MEVICMHSNCLSLCQSKSEVYWRFHSIKLVHYKQSKVKIVNRHSNRFIGQHVTHIHTNTHTHFAYLGYIHRSKAGMSKLFHSSEDPCGCRFWFRPNRLVQKPTATQAFVEYFGHPCSKDYLNWKRVCAVRTIL